MSLNLVNLDEKTRQFMLEEINMDIAAGTIFISSRLSPQGQAAYLNLLKEATQNHDDSWLADYLEQGGMLNATEQRRKPNGGFTTARVPVNAAQVLAEGEFNRYYVRGLCRRGIEEGKTNLEVYRAKEVSHPRSESQAKIGTRIDANALLIDLRTYPGVDTALRLPSGPNSGLSVKLPFI